MPKELLWGVLAGAVILAGCNASSETRPPPETSRETGSAVVDYERLRPQVTAFCGDCHALPPASSFPQAGWYHEVERGYEFYYASGRTDLAIPRKRDVIEFFRAHAPEELQLRSVNVRPAPQAAHFRPATVELPLGAGGQDLALAHVLWLPSSSPGGHPLWVLSEMRRGTVTFVETDGVQPKSAEPDGPHLRATQQFRGLNPCHSAAADLDGDGATDFVIADLGSFQPEDHDRGRVLWIPSHAASGEPPVELLTGVGRVADVRPGDFDGDGDQDLVVAEFGWQKTGRILLLTNTGVADGRPQFTPSVLDERHGTIHVPTVDLDGDGRLDFVALISQEHEAVVVFYNRGGGKFHPVTLFSATDPSFGSSGIELTDLDGDGDPDVVYTNGDTFDGYYLKPSHGVRWLENRGDQPWRVHLLARIPGVMRAVPGDLDGDGDLDIVAVALVPSASLPKNPQVNLASVVWLEQLAPGRFSPHVLEVNRPSHVTLEVGDFDGDGDVDFATGNFEADQRTALTVWWNEGAAVDAGN